MGSSKKTRWLDLSLSCILIFFTAMIMISWSASIGPICEYFKIPISTGMLGSSVVIFTMGIGCLLQGVLLHKIGYKKAGMIFLSIIIILQFIIPTCPNWGAVLLLRAVQGLGIVFTLLSSFIGVTFPLEERGFAEGIFAASMGLSTGVGAVLTTYFLPVFGWKNTFAILGIFMAAASILWLSLVKEPTKNKEREQDEKLKKNKQAYGSSRIWCLAGISFSNCWQNFGMGMFVIVYLTEGLRYGTIAGLITFCIAVSSMIASPSGGKFSDMLTHKFSPIKARAYSIIIGFLIATLASVLYPHITSLSFAATILATLILGFGGPWTNGPMWALPADVFGPKHVGEVSGFMLLIGQVAGAVSVYFISLASDIYNWSVAFYVLAIGTIAGIAPTLLISHLAHSPEDE